MASEKITLWRCLFMGARTFVKALLASTVLPKDGMVYNLDMANLPEIVAQSSEPTPAERYREKIADLVSQGWTPARIARRLHPKDQAARRRARDRIHYMLKNDPQVALQVGLNSKVDLLVGLGPTTRAVVKRARRGRIDAAKLVFETTGFHNPKVKHEHSGEISVKLDIPRPQFDHEVSDAEVVE